jgi:hypothetical protein
MAAGDLADQTNGRRGWRLCENPKPAIDPSWKSLIWRSVAHGGRSGLESFLSRKGLVPSFHTASVGSEHGYGKRATKALIASVIPNRSSLSVTG